MMHQDLLADLRSPSCVGTIQLHKGLSEATSDIKVAVFLCFQSHALLWLSLERLWRAANVQHRQRVGDWRCQRWNAWTRFLKIAAGLDLVHIRQATSTKGTLAEEWQQGFFFFACVSTHALLALLVHWLSVCLECWL